MPPIAIAGFTLIEALVSMVLMGMVLTALATVTAQWLPNWDRGFARAQRSELISIALDRLVADVGAAEFVTANRDSKLPVFDGTTSAVTLVRAALGPNSRRGLEMVRIAETSDRDEIVTARSTAPFSPLVTGAPLSGFSAPVVLLRSPFRVTFAYAGTDGILKATWQNSSLLPKIVRVTVRNATSERTLSVSTDALVHVELPAACASAKDKTSCAHRPDFNASQKSEAQ